MSKKSFVVIAILSVIITYGVAMINDLISGSLVGGKGGLPFSFASGSSTDGLLLALDIIFWFVIIWGIWKLFRKVIDRK